MLNMKNCHFICNDLLGTNFDYCDLEGGDFAARARAGVRSGARTVVAHVGDCA